MKKLLVLLITSIISVSIIACGGVDVGTVEEEQTFSGAEEINSDESEVAESENEVQSEEVIEEGPKVLVRVEGGSCCEEYEYDQNGNCIKITYKMNGYDGESQTEYEYDEFDRKIKELYYNDGNWVQSIIWEYDSTGKIIKERKESLYQDYEYWHEYTYDENNNLVSKVAFSGSDGEYTETGVYTSYQYDDFGNVIEEFTYDTINEWTTQYEYNEVGQKISMSIYRNEGELMEYYEYEYDVSGTLVRQYSGVDVFYSYTEYVYDEEGFLTEENMYSMDGQSMGNVKKYEYGHLSVVK